MTAIVTAGRRMDARGWVPATAGNISVRLDEARIAITRSGGHKGFLDASFIMQVRLDGTPLTPGKPSAETGLHTQLYRLFPEIGAVVHGHSVAGTVLTMATDADITFTGYEVIKALPGQTTHDTTLTLPVLPNDQDISRLARVMEPILLSGSPPGYYLRGHGAYAWGPDLAAALARLEALEFLLACELERMRIR